MQARTINTIQNTLSKSTRNTDSKRKEDKYLRCVFNPFRSLGRGTMRPDSGSNKIIMRDILQTFDITTTGPYGIKLSPMYPYVVSVWNSASATMTVNGTSIPNTELLGVGYTPSAGKAEADYGGTFFAMTDYDRARISTIGWRLMYTGKSLDAQGYIMVDSVPFTVDLVDRQTPITCSYVTSAGTVANYAAGNNIAYVQVETSWFNSGSAFVPLAPTQTSQLFRPEAGAQGVLRRSAYSPNHPFKPVYNGGFSVLDNRQPNPEAIRCMITASKPVPAGNTIVDDEFDSTMIYVTGAGNYRLEIVVCLEAIVTQASTLEPLAKASPPLDQPVLEKESKLMASLPPAVSISRPVVPESQLKPEPTVEEKLLKMAQDAMNKKLNGKAPPLPPQPARTTAKASTPKVKTK